MVITAPCTGRGKASPPRQPEKPSEFIRLHSPAGENLALQVAIASFRHPQSGTEVDLVGAVHVADAAYYDKLNTLFETYDAVLFEMVGGRDGLTRQDLSGKGTSPVGTLQNIIRSVLDLEFQLEAIDYTRDNFFHADMSAEDFFREQRKQNEGMLALLLRATEEQEKINKKRPGSTPRIALPQLLRIVFSPSSADELKLLFAHQLILSEGLVEGLERDGETVIVSGRNRVAMAKLEEVRTAGKKHIAIFYGAAHLPGMERLLTNEGGFERTDRRWITAWDIKIGSRAQRKNRRKTPSNQQNSKAIQTSPPSS